MQQLFIDMANIIARDDVLIQNIEDQVRRTVDHTEAANVEMTRAVKSAKSFRTVNLIIFTLIILRLYSSFNDNVENLVDHRGCHCLVIGHWNSCLAGKFTTYNNCTLTC